jgi:ankyrin repeat protein
MTCLYTHVSFGRKEIAQFLLEHGADIHEGCGDGDTPLRIITFSLILIFTDAAVARKSPDLVKWLIDMGADMMRENDDGKTPLAWAALEGWKILKKIDS